MRVLLLAVSMLVTGCVMRPTVNLGIDVPAPYTVQAWGYPSEDGSPASNSYNRLSINLEAAPPFLLLLPDGYRVSSKQIDSALLEQHVAPIVRDDKGNIVSRIHHAGKDKWYWMVFTLNKKGIASQLSLYACRHAMPKLIGTIDGQYEFDFPITEKEMLLLFNGPVRKGKDFQILGWGCD